MAVLVPAAGGAEHGQEDGRSICEPRLALVGFAMSRAERSVAMTADIDRQAREHLLRSDGQEDLCFAQWRGSRGRTRTTALIERLILPREGERNVHGNASFEPMYLERAMSEVAASGAGLNGLPNDHPLKARPNDSRFQCHALRYRRFRCWRWL